MTTLTLKDGNGNQWELPNTQRSDDTVQGKTDTHSAPGLSSDKNFISLVAEKESFELTGLVTAPKLSGKSSPNSYSSDWRTALAEFAARGEGFCHSSQGTGYTLEENDRGRTSLNVVIEEFSWTYEKEAIYQLSYELTLRRGQGLLPTGSISVASPTPGSKDSVPTLAPNDVNRSLKGFERLQMTKTLGDLSVAQVAFGGADENQIFAEQGPIRRFEYRGTYPGSNSARNKFDDDIRSLIKNDTYDFETVFPGYTVEVGVMNWNSIRKWEHGSDLHEYTIPLEEGRNSA